MAHGSIPESEIGDRVVMSCPMPTRIIDKNGPVNDEHGRARFQISTPNYAYMEGGNLPVRQKFYEDYVFKSNKATRACLAVFFYIVSTTRWAKTVVITDQNGNPLIKNGESQVAILAKGNVTTGKTFEKIAQATNLNIDVVRKALSFWEKEKIIKRIKEKSRKSKASNNKHRTDDVRRYEIDARYVWRGCPWEGVHYDLSGFCAVLTI